MDTTPGTRQSSVTITLPVELRDRIQALARAEDLSISQFVSRHLTAEFAAAKQAAAIAANRNSGHGAALLE